MPEHGLQRDRAAIHPERTLDVLVPEMPEVIFSAPGWLCWTPRKRRAGRYHATRPVVAVLKSAYTGEGICPKCRPPYTERTFDFLTAAMSDATFKPVASSLTIAAAGCSA